MLVTDDRGVPAIIHRMGSSLAQLAFPTGELELIKLSDVRLPSQSLIEDFTPSPVMLAVLNSFDPMLNPRALEGIIWNDVTQPNVAYFNHQVVEAIRKTLDDDTKVLSVSEMISMIDSLNVPERAGDLTWMPAIMPRHWHVILVHEGSVAAMQAILDGLAMAAPVTISMMYADGPPHELTRGSRGKMGPRTSAPRQWIRSFASSSGKRTYDLTLVSDNSDDSVSSTDNSDAYPVCSPAPAHVAKKHKT